jgi:tol-pal system protein YbgF
LFVLGSAGCTNVALQARVKELSQQVSDLNQRHREALQRQEELENRVLLLTDQLETQTVATSRRGAVDLPVVTLRPQPQPMTHSLSIGQMGVAGVAGVAGGPVPGQDDPVSFVGEARSDEPAQIRPLLRAEGERFAAAVPPEPPPAEPRRQGATPHATRRGRSAPSSQAQAQTVVPPSGDNLGVVPVPRLSSIYAPGRAPASTGSSTSQAMLTASAAAAIPSAPAAPAPRPTPDAEGEAPRLYRLAYDHVRAGRFPEAERDLREFVRRFPRHDYADNAQYWLGETYYARKTYSEAATAFRAVVERWPTGNKAPDALLKLGYSLLQLGDAGKGRGVLQQVVTHYPNTEAARLADRRLSELKDGK